MNSLPDIKIIYNRLKQSAKSRNIEFSLTLTQLNHITWPISCPILGIPLKFNRGKIQDNSYSFDRIDSKLGYHIDNLIIISWKANRLKNNATLEESQRIADYYSGVYTSQQTTSSMVSDDPTGEKIAYP